ncbi:helix-turn-helix domain-containing protein [Antarcticibacterium flavum]|uniref:Helix-turn-helix domain-containing protein n=1 Tax=Antarcticibacterium flavum TaxID=2058175 RepID=A0A5B7X423_9FLAO|nr:MULTISPECIES: helix-turn-helix domain-containing protein [Antarcticibacterium]MCM4158428.1 hypothetical protein [Antarcticibacterium sp. W02-3]QCY70186.1 helix-turn-helix domain-containing protein [Antarcticibacterium flavum]
MSTSKKIFKANLFLLGVFLYPSCVEMSGQNKIEFNFQDLQSLSYKEIRSKETKLFEDEELGKLDKLVNFHIAKAKAEEDTLEIAHAIYYKYAISDDEKALDYADSIINLTQASTHHNYPTVGYSLKGHYYYHSGRLELALDNYLIALQLAEKKKNIEQQREISLAIAAIRNLTGQHYAALELYNKALNLLKKNKKYKREHYSDYIVLLYNLSLTQLRLKENDSARIYAAQGIEITRNDDRNFKDFVLLDAQINYYEDNLQTANDTLEKYVSSLEGTSKAIKLYYLGKIQDQLGNTEKAIEYFEKIDSIVNYTQDGFPEIKDVYHHLILHTIQQNNKEKQIDYIDKLVYYDSVLSSGQERILNKSTLALDIPLLKQQKLKLQNQLKAKRRYKLLAGFLGGITILSGLHFYTRNRKMKRRLRILMEEEPKKKPVSKKTLDFSLAIPEDIKNDLILKLDNFENSNRYLDKVLDLPTLANELHTNTSYLSLVINYYKKKSFPNYLKELRISYAIQELKINLELTKYSNQGLAELFGFKTGESFSKAFLKETGVYPSRFIAELKARKAGGLEI